MSTGSDDGSRAGANLLREIAGREAHMVARRTAVAMFTPACLVSGRLGVGVAFLREAGFRLLRLSRVELADDDIERIWMHQAARFSPWRWAVARRLFSAGPTVVAVACNRGDTPAAARLKALQGPSSPELLSPEHLRWHLGAVNKINNFVHVPESTAAMIRELPIMLGHEEAARAWQAAVMGRAIPDLERVLEVVDSGERSDAICFIRTALRLRWRGVLRGEASGEAPASLREALTAQLDWVHAAPSDGWRTIEHWRRRYGRALIAPQFSAWLGAESPYTWAIEVIDALLADYPLEFARLNTVFDWLVPDKWERLALETQAIAQELSRSVGPSPPHTMTNIRPS